MTTTLMTYPDFKDHMVQSFQRRYPSASEIAVHSVQKNNGVTLDGLTILQENTCVTPTIYLNDLYREYRNGCSLSEIEDRIAESYDKNKNPCIPSLEDFSHFDRIKEQVVFRLVSRSANAAMLEEVPFIPYLDLALVFCMMVEVAPSQKGSILIHNDHLRCWGVTVEELLDYARINTTHLFLPDYTPIEDVITSMLSEEDARLFPELSPAFPMYILTNHEKLYGATVICYPHLLDDIAGRVGGDFFILPSSIHEVIIVPKNCDITLEDLTEMVRDVNATQVAKDELLSDHAYYYDKEKACVCY